MEVVNGRVRQDVLFEVATGNDAVILLGHLIG